MLQVADRLPGLRRIVVIETKGLRSYAVAERARIVTFAQVEEDGQRRQDLEQGRWMRRWMASAWPISG